MQRGRTSTIPRLPERLGGQESARLSGGGGDLGYGGQQGGNQQGQLGGRDGRLGVGGEDTSIANGGGGEETERSTSTALTSAGRSISRSMRTCAVSHCQCDDATFINLFQYFTTS